jgi:hypothetical protein
MTNMFRVERIQTMAEVAGGLRRISISSAA